MCECVQKGRDSPTVQTVQPGTLLVPLLSVWDLDELMGSRDVNFHVCVQCMKGK